MSDPVLWLQSLAQDCEQAAQSSKRFSRRHYYGSYVLMTLSLAGSIGAAVLAFWEQIDRTVVGIVALLPAISATIAGQLRLIEKGNWHFRRKHVMERLARDFRLSSERNPDWDAADLANRTLATQEENLESDWDSVLAFQFQSTALGARSREA